MRPHRILARRLRSLFLRNRLEAEMREEMAFHLDQRAADYVSDGAPETEARYAAERRFGNAGSLQERARDAWGWGWLERTFKDLRFALRQLTASPGFTLLAILTLGLGIGANTAMFSMVNGIIFKPLPYPNTPTLQRIYRATPQSANGHIAPADFLAFRRAAEGFAVAAYTAGNASLSEPGHPAHFAYGARCTANLLSLLGLPPQLGRDFLPEEENVGRHRVVILSQRVWRNQYGARADIIGQRIRIDGEPHEVVGVMPSAMNDWRHLGVIDFFRPLAFTPEEAGNRSRVGLRIIIRLSDSRSPAEVAAFVAGFGRTLAAQFPEVNAETWWRAVPLQSTITGRSALPMFAMMVALSALVLLIACSNLANLLLARTIARAREFAVRAALGASRMQLLRPLAAESLLLALAGGGCALVFAAWFRDYMAVRSIGDNGEGVYVELGWPVFAWAFGAALVTALAFGLAPALFALRLDLNSTIKSGGRAATGGRGAQRFRHILIVGQFAVAMTLLAAAGVEIRGLNELNTRRSGWDSNQLVTGTVLLPAGKYADADSIGAFHRLALERLGALPGVASASLSSFTPFFTWSDIRRFVIDGNDRPRAGREPAASFNAVSAGYFETYRTPLRAGRTFTEHDTGTSQRVYVISESTARALFGAGNPLGRRIAPVVGPGESVRWGEIVGVVRDIEPSVNEINPVTNQIYTPLAQEPRRQVEIAIRAQSTSPSSLVDQIRATVTALDPDLPVRDLQPAQATIERSNYQVAVGRDIFGAMGFLGLGLASLGIYGVIARAMAQRTGEFAIRLALGATLNNITRLVLASGLKLALLGSLLGIVGAISACQILTTLNPALRANSVPIVIATCALLIAIALLASWLPARRAGRVDAMAVLRAE